MNIIPTGLDGVFEIKNKVFEDHRGVFVKTIHEGIFQKAGLNADFKESFYSTSKKGVLRGMHFQLPPYDHAKLVYVTHGQVLDVAVDIRKESPTFGKTYSTKLSAKRGNSLYMTKGFAHGFLTLSEVATVVYSTTTVYEPRSDTGILWNSFDFDWGEVNEELLSDRDKKHPMLEQL